MTLVFSASMGVLLLVASVALVEYITRDIEGDADRMLKNVSLMVRHEIVAEHDRSIASIMERERRLYGERLGVTLVDTRGSVIESSGANAPPWPHHDGDGWRVVTTNLGTSTAVVGMDWTRPAAALRTQKTAIGFFSLILFVAATAGAWALVGKTLSPIGMLSRQAHAASGASSACMEVQLKAPSKDTEIVELVQTLNAMLARLSDAAAQRGRFYAAASHELRTPLQALSGHLELAASRERTLEEYRDAVAEAHAQTRRLVNLTRDLLLLNQLDGAAAPPPEQVALAGVCNRTLQQLAPLIQERDLKLSMFIAGEPVLNAALSHVEMVVRNLVENAVKYADAGGAVDIHFDQQEGTRVAALVIFNTCQPVVEWLPARTFEPLYRPDVSRSSATGGNGLGLTICKAVCDLNKWTIAVTQVNGGVQARVSFRNS